MLTLSRKVGDVINLGKDVTVTVLEIRRNRVIVGVAAPKSVRILRGELMEHKDASHAVPEEKDANRVPPLTREPDPYAWECP